MNCDSLSIVILNYNFILVSVNAKIMAKNMAHQYEVVVFFFTLVPPIINFLYSLSSLGVLTSLVK